MNIFALFLNVVAGVVAGVFGGMGMGGGTLLIPILTILLGFEQKLAQAINLISFLAMALLSLIVHFKNGLVKIKNLWLMIIFGIIFSFLGAFLAGKINSLYLRKIFGVFLIILAIFQGIGLFKK